MIEATFRIERARLIAGLARMVRNVDLAEELAQDALVVALSEWPTTGVPANPGAAVQWVNNDTVVYRFTLTMQDNVLAVGGSSGTAVAAALRVAERGCDGPVVVLLADSWDRYLSRPWLVG